jgi:hypothetical protein
VNFESMCVHNYVPRLSCAVEENLPTAGSLPDHALV